MPVPRTGRPVKSRWGTGGSMGRVHPRGRTDGPIKARWHTGRYTGVPSRGGAQADGFCFSAYPLNVCGQSCTRLSAYSLIGADFHLSPSFVRIFGYPMITLCAQIFQSSGSRFAPTMWCLFKQVAEGIIDTYFRLLSDLDCCISHCIFLEILYGLAQPQSHIEPFQGSSIASYSSLSALASPIQPEMVL